MISIPIPSLFLRLITTKSTKVLSMLYAAKKERLRKHFSDFWVIILVICAQSSATSYTFFLLPHLFSSFLCSTPFP